jgi:hypothetical protein
MKKYTPARRSALARTKQARVRVQQQQKASAGEERLRWTGQPDWIIRIAED